MAEAARRIHNGASVSAMLEESAAEVAEARETADLVHRPRPVNAT